MSWTRDAILVGVGGLLVYLADEFGIEFSKKVKAEDLDFEELPEEGTTLVLLDGEQVGEIYEEEDGWIGSVTGDLEGQPFSVASAPYLTRPPAVAFIVKTLIKQSG